MQWKEWENKTMQSIAKHFKAFQTQTSHHTLNSSGFHSKCIWNCSFSIWQSLSHQAIGNCDQLFRHSMYEHLVQYIQYISNFTIFSVLSVWMLKHTFTQRHTHTLTHSHPHTSGLCLVSYMYSHYKWSTSNHWLQRCAHLLSKTSFW